MLISLTLEVGRKLFDPPRKAFAAVPGSRTDKYCPMSKRLVSASRRTLIVLDATHVARQARLSDRRPAAVDVANLIFAVGVNVVAVRQLLEVENGGRVCLNMKPCHKDRCGY
jgi:hypothetical protein